MFQDASHQEWRHPISACHFLYVPKGGVFVHWSFPLQHTLRTAVLSLVVFHFERAQSSAQGLHSGSCLGIAFLSLWVPTPSYRFYIYQIFTL